jgi:hypothetical protein
MVSRLFGKAQAERCGITPRSLVGPVGEIAAAISAGVGIV